MTWKELTRLANLSSWWIRAAIAVAIVLLIWAAAVYIGGLKDRAVQSEAGATLAGARTQSAGESITTIDHNAQGAAAIDDRVKGSSDAIVNAAPADRDAAAVRELCVSPSNRRLAECRLLNARP